MQTPFHVHQLQHSSLWMKDTQLEKHQCCRVEVAAAVERTNLSNSQMCSSDLEVKEWAAARPIPWSRWIKQISVEISMSFPSSFRSVCERGTDLCISVGWLSLYLYKAMTLQDGFNRSKCIKDDEILCEKEVHLSILVEKALMEKIYFKRMFSDT